MKIFLLHKKGKRFLKMLHEVMKETKSYVNTASLSICPVVMESFSLPNTLLCFFAMSIWIDEQL